MHHLKKNSRDVEEELRVQEMIVLNRERNGEKIHTETLRDDVSCKQLLVWDLASMFAWTRKPMHKKKLVTSFSKHNSICITHYEKTNR